MTVPRNSPSASTGTPGRSPEPAKTRQTKAQIIQCPFDIIVDTREQLPYDFSNLYVGPSGRSSRLLVPTTRAALKLGDYAVFGYPNGAVERKSKEDLYSSISQRRENFVGRLETACMEYDFFAVIVEAEWSELLSSPPAFTQYSPKSLCRTIHAWMVRYPTVQWIMLPSRAHAEAFTFRILERYWKDKREFARAGSRWSRELIRRWDVELAAETDESISPAGLRAEDATVIVEEVQDRDAIHEGVAGGRVDSSTTGPGA